MGELLELADVRLAEGVRGRTAENGEVAEGLALAGERDGEPGMDQRSVRGQLVFAVAVPDRDRPRRASVRRTDDGLALGLLGGEPQGRDDLLALG